MADLPEISKVSLPTGTTYAIKDEYAREQISALSGAMEFLGVTTTQISDGSSTNPIVIAGQSVTAKAGDVVIYGSSEYVFSAADNKWHEFGSTGSLKALAFKDSASGSYQPVGSVSKPTFTGTTETISVEYQPAGSVSTPTITVTKQTAAISGITSYTAGSAPAWSATVSSETLRFSWDAGAVTTIGSSSYTVMTGATGSASQPTFTGTTTTISTSFQPAGSVSQPTFTGTTDTITVS